MKSNSGVYTEEFGPDEVDENRCNYDNKIFKVGTKLTYDYVFKDVNNFDHKFKILDYEWILTNGLNDDSAMLLNEVTINVLSGLKPMIDYNPEYNQTLISYHYTNVNNYSIPGVIENKMNVWMHPPRDKYFKILELNPFPFIQHPLDVGNTREWQVNIGSSWGDPRWIEFDGNKKFKSKYKIIDKKKIKTHFGKLTCYEVEAIADSEIGETKLKFLFNEEYGFIKLEYININSTKLIFNLVNFETNDEF